MHHHHAEPPFAVTADMCMRESVVRLRRFERSTQPFRRHDQLPKAFCRRRPRYHRRRR